MTSTLKKPQEGKLAGGDGGDGGGLTFALQALLSRHESYMIESEAERATLLASTTRLERDKWQLQSENKRVAQENTQLLCQLEGTNAQIADSDARIASLVAMLGEAKRENQRLTVLAGRTGDLERLVAEMESSRDEEINAARRWSDAERRLAEVNEQVLSMEREARDEREKHVEMIGRAERNRAAERELEGAAGRINGAAAVIAGTQGDNRGRHRDTIGNGTNVVSHFVHDILQDNANLQADIVELRGLLQASNDEVQTLREQVLAHEPSSASDQHTSEPVSLMEELRRSDWDKAAAAAAAAVSQEVHVHHHHHARITAKKESRSSFRRPPPPPRRRGPSISSNHSHLNAPLQCQAPLARAGSGSITTSMPCSGGNTTIRHSAQSSATDFSNVSTSPLPSSPYSDQRTSSIFDRIEPGFESSRPTSPESADLGPPPPPTPHLPPPSAAAAAASSKIPFGHQRNSADLTNVSEDEPPSKSLEASSNKPRAKMQHRAHILHGIDSDQTTFEATDLSANALDELHTARPPLGRSSSDESLLSISGMDIHLPQHRNGPPPLLLLRRRGGGLLTPKLSPAAASASDPSTRSIAFPPSQPLASIAEVNASSSSSSSSSCFSSNIATPSSATTDRHPIPLSLLSGLAVGRSSRPPPRNKGLGRLVRKWVGGRWGLVPVSSAANLREQLQAATAAAADYSPLLEDPTTRNPGINQKGPVVGWQPLTATPSQVHAEVLDEGLLREALAE